MSEMKNHSKNANLFNKSIKDRGLIGTFQVIISYFTDYLFDIKYGTNTFSSVEVDGLMVDHINKEHAERYQLTHSISLRKLLRELKIPPGKILIDLGSGKGKVLLTAGEFGFKEARGIEFSSILCDIANKNCLIYKTITNTNTEFNIINSDVLDYQMKDDEDVFFLFNPFDEFILMQIIQKISLSLQRRGRRIWVIYNNAVHKDIIDEYLKPGWKKNFSFLSDEYMVFQIQ